MNEAQKTLTASGLYIAFVCLFGLSFLLFGWGCLASPSMFREFARFNLSSFRILAGVLEMLGGLGLLVGLWAPAIGVFSAAGLMIMMAVGVTVRVRAGDSLPLMAPAGLCALVNLYIGWGFVNALQM